MLQKTRGVSVFPVGLVTQLGVSSPVVQNGHVVGFFDGWNGGRMFAMDMAGFAVSVELLQKKSKAMMPLKAGYEEDGFLQSLDVTPEDLEPLANNCTQILVWHTQTQRVAPIEAQADDGMADTNIVHLLRHMAENKVL
ncbi:Galactosylgalactosylxylosylprotein 3-beta-glucuronosyltransferase P [Amphibalanus amphitrite]|uniref:Galactosylgalactosylxylosylprotein 3-beta-glucuronosyltransferase n=1 Tax=Amphibalanus amphitrite TaxID=1232801 RepID=A0A6A4V1E7_AMPAM|nr:Galactosylgalactosylxylosylprotein 3-beta-glucuronosyltransferase P [Amphibalanus amphitrite]